MATVMEMAKVLRWDLTYHPYRSDKSAEGFPDLVMLRGRRLIFAELKREKEHPTAEQHEWLASLQQGGFEAYLWRPSDLDEIERVLAE